MFKLCITGNLGFEVWKDIPGYEGLYQASTYGRIRNSNGKIMKQGFCRGNYLKIGLTKNKMQNSHIVNKLIGITFLPKLTISDTEINHKDENKSNNRVENLEWCSHNYNINYGTRTIRTIEGESIAVVQYDLKGNFIAKYISSTEAARINNYSKGNICSCCRGKRNMANGYIWKYA